MKKKKMKKLIGLILVAVTLMLTSCSGLGFEITMPVWGRGYNKAFENDTLIHTFSERVYSFDITDDYICAVHGRGGSKYFVYKKGGNVIANDSY